MKKIILLLMVFVCEVSNSHAQNTVVRGEVNGSGTYVNLAADSTGRLNIVGSGFSGTLVNRSGTLTTAGTAQTIAPVNSGRKYLLIQNVSDTVMWCNFTTAAVQSQPSFMLIAGSSFVMESNVVSGEAISCVSSVAGKTFTAKEM